jgi:hypothetical protein
MTGTDFIEAVTADPELQFVHKDGEEPSFKDFYVEFIPTQLITKFSEEAISSAGAADLIAVCRGEREPKVLQQISRVVGYYSKIQNWNKSKLGELNDRQHGNYTTEGENNGNS